MADSDVIGGIENLTNAVSGETPSYEYKDPNTDMMKAISKCVDAATGETGTEYKYNDPNTDVIQKMEELATAIASSGGGGGFETVIEDGLVSNNNYGTVTFDDISGYKYILIKYYALNTALTTKNYTLLPVSAIPEDGAYTASMLFDSGSNRYSNVSITRKSFSCTYYAGSWVKIYVSIAGTNDDIDIYELS